MIRKTVLPPFFILFMLFANTSMAASLNDTIIDLEKQTSGDIGVAVLDTKTNQIWSYKGNQRFPMMSTFKTLACAKMLHDADKKIINKKTETAIAQKDLIPWSPITEKYVGKSISTEKACEATMLMSDNTAANIVLQQIGSPSSLTAFLRLMGDSTTQLDRIEPTLNEAKKGDIRDTTTPIAMVNTINKLLLGNTLTTTDKVTLKKWMMDNKVSDPLLRSILPIHWSIADRSGAGGYGSRGITAIIWHEHRLPLIISIYLTQTDLTLAERNDIIVHVGSALFSQFNVK